MAVALPRGLKYTSIFVSIFLPLGLKGLNSLLCADVPLRNYSLTHSTYGIYFEMQRYVERKGVLSIIYRGSWSELL